MAYYLLPDEYDFHNKEALVVQRKSDDHAGTPIKHDVGTDYRDAGEIETNYSLQAVYDLQLRTRSIVLANCIVVTKPSSDIIVGIGKKVTFTRNNGTPETLTVGGHETPIKGRASYNSPLMKGLIGKRVGDIIDDIVIDEKFTEIEILAIEDDPIPFQNSEQK